MYPSESGKPPIPGSRTITGYCIKWRVVSPVRKDFSEVFLPGSLLWGDDLVACTEHDRTNIIARLSDGSLRIKEDEIGLFVEFDPVAYEFVARVRTGGTTGLSISFETLDAQWSTTTNGRPLCTVRRARLVEVSVVNAGAHETTLGLGNRPDIWRGNERAYV